jgi:large subunit ribosomal protein L5
MAGGEKKPGGPPKYDGDSASSMPEPEEKKESLRPGHESKKMVQSRVEYKTKLYKRLKGKFMPMGPKPWDRHRFMKVCIQTRLKAKQASNTKIINQVVEEMRRISGMHPKVVKARHNVANFGWRKGFPCGVAVTMYGPRMYDFLQRLNMVILPRVRDFEGLFPNSFDNFGNFWMGLQNQEPFRELDALIDERVIVHGFDIGIINNCLTQPDGLALMKNYGFPFGDAHPMKAVKKKVSFQVMRPEKMKR